MSENTPEVSERRRREVIDALRRGTVPSHGLDLLAVGLSRFEASVAENLATAAFPPSAVRDVIDGWLFTLESDVIASGVDPSDEATLDREGRRTPASWLPSPRRVSTRRPTPSG